MTVLVLRPALDDGARQLLLLASSCSHGSTGRLREAQGCPEGDEIHQDDVGDCQWHDGLSSVTDVGDVRITVAVVAGTSTVLVTLTFHEERELGFWDSKLTGGPQV